jgi:hypothetical protein
MLMIPLIMIGWLTMQTPAAAREAEVTSTAILGVEVGMTLADARDRLQPFGRSDARRVTAGIKQVWKLDTTGFEWIALRTDADGRVVWITGHRRGGQELPFESIAPAPLTANDSTAVWHVEGTYRGQRLTLSGAKRRAQVVTLMAVTP